jgi:hypothetical protein
MRVRFHGKKNNFLRFDLSYSTIFLFFINIIQFILKNYFSTSLYLNKAMHFQKKKKDLRFSKPNEEMECEIFRELFSELNNTTWNFPGKDTLYFIVTDVD